MCCSAVEIIGQCVREALPCLPAVYGFITVMCSTELSVLPVRKPSASPWFLITVSEYSPGRSGNTCSNPSPNRIPVSRRCHVDKRGGTVNRTFLVQPDTSGKMTCILVWNVENRGAITGKLRNTGGIMRIRGAAALTWGATPPWNRDRIPPGIGGLPLRSPAQRWPFIGSWGPGLPWGLLPVPALLLC